MTLEQKVQKIIELPHGKEIWAAICEIRDTKPTTEVGSGRPAKEHPLYDELVLGLAIWMSSDS